MIPAARTARRTLPETMYARSPATITSRGGNSRQNEPGPSGRTLYSSEAAASLAGPEAIVLVVLLGMAGSILTDGAAAASSRRTAGRFEAAATQRSRPADGTYLPRWRFGLLLIRWRSPERPLD